MPKSSFLTAIGRRVSLKTVTFSAVALIGVAGGARPIQNAVAQGETRSLTIYHAHTKEQETVTYRRSGAYDAAGLQKLNWMLRDWRMDEETRMDPQLFDILWEVYRVSGSSSPIHVVSAYRSPGTNAMLARRSRGVAKNSQHMSGRAMDFNLPDVSMATVRDIGLRLQNGGVGYYPRANNPWVHLDTGGVRHWPKVTRDHLVRLFPDEKTVHIPRDGKPLAGFEAARTIIEARGGSVSSGYIDIAEGRATGKTLFQILFGGGEADEEGDVIAQRGKKGRNSVAARSRNQQTAALAPDTGEPSAVSFFSQSNNSTSVGLRPAPRPTLAPIAQETPPQPDAKREEAKPAEPKAQDDKRIDTAAVDPKAAAAVPVSTKANDEDDKSRWVNVPLPQRRPAALPVGGPVMVSMPLPQARPAALLASAAPDDAKAGAAAAVGRPVSVPLPAARPAGLPSSITAGLRTGASDPLPQAAMAYAPNAASGTPPSRTAAADKSSGGVDRGGLNSLLAQIAMSSNSDRGGRVAPLSVVASSDARIAPARFETPRVEAGSFTGSAIRPIGMGFKAN